MVTKPLVAACLLLAAALAGCTPRSQTSTLDAQVERQNVQIQRLSSQVGQVEDSRPGQAEMWAQMQSMRQELNTLNGRMYDMNDGKNTEVDMLKQRVYRLENVVRQMASQMAINVDSLDAPISLDGPRTMPEGYTPYNPGLSQSSSAPAYAIPPSVSGPADPMPDAASGAVSVTSGTGIAVDPDGSLRSGTSEASGAKDTAATLYDSGIKAFDERRYQDAVMAFKDFTGTFPQHNLAGNAHFWQGESYYQLKDYPRAALAYQEVISKYPGSSKVQSSMLKQGIALYNANKKSAARERLQELVSRYPNSQEATRAKQFLADNK